MGRVLFWFICFNGPLPRVYLAAANLLLIVENVRSNLRMVRSLANRAWEKNVLRTFSAAAAVLHLARRVMKLSFVFAMAGMVFEEVGVCECVLC